MVFWLAAGDVKTRPKWQETEIVFILTICMYVQTRVYNDIHMHILVIVLSISDQAINNIKPDYDSPNSTVSSECQQRLISTLSISAEHSSYCSFV